MTLIISLLLYIFGLKATTGTLDYDFSQTDNTKKAIVTTNGDSKKKEKKIPFNSSDPENRS